MAEEACPNIARAGNQPIAGWDTSHVTNADQSDVDCRVEGACNECCMPFVVLYAYVFFVP